MRKPENGIVKHCQQCKVELIKVGKFWICPEHGQIDQDKPVAPLCIFLSYGHDENETLVRMIKAHLEERGHSVWFDKNPEKEKGIRPGEDWRRAITDGIKNSHNMLAFLSKHSTRVPGVCLDEIGIALSQKHAAIRTILVEDEQEVQQPSNISHLQYLDMHDWKKEYALGGDTWNEWYQNKFSQLVEVIESKESRQFAGEIETLSKALKPTITNARIQELYIKPFSGREWMFQEVEAWRSHRHCDNRLFWIMGDPGVGKSAFSANLARDQKGDVIAVHFCEWNKPNSRDPRRIVRNIAFQLATRLPSYRKLLLDLQEINQLEGKDAQDLFDYLLTNPLQHDIDGGRHRYFIVIDALDEANENQRNPLVDMLAQNGHKLPEWLGILITSRPEKEVKTPLQGLKGLDPLILNATSEENRNDIREYLYNELTTELKDRDSDAIVEAILDKSEGVFLYAEYVCAQLQKNVLSLNRLDEFPDGLAGIYEQYFKRQFPDITNYKAITRYALGVIAAAREPLLPDQLACIFDWDTYQLRDFINSIGSIFSLIDGKLQPFHKSLLDWLVNEDRAGYYAVIPEEGNKRLAEQGCVQRNAGVETMDIYFLRHLPVHLAKAERIDDLAALLKDLSFLEAKVVADMTFELSSDFAEALRVMPWNHSERKLIALLDEALRRDIYFIARHADDYPQALFQCLWNSGWWYDCPEAKEHYVEPEGGWSTIPPWKNPAPTKLYAILENAKAKREQAKPGGLWLRSLRPPAIHLGTEQKAVFQGHTSRVQCVAFSPNGHLIVSGAWDKTVRVWETQTGRERLCMKGHTDAVFGVAFSPDGSRIVSGSRGNGVRVWDAQTGHELRCVSNTDMVRCVAFSPNGKLIASGGDKMQGNDYAIHVWESVSGVLLQTLYGHSHIVHGVAFSPDGTCIVSGSIDGTVRLWDTQTGQEIRCMAEHLDDVRSVAFSPDGNRIAGACYSILRDEAVRVWDSRTGQALLCIKDSSPSIISCVAFSPDGRHIIGGDEINKTIRVWDSSSGEHLRCMHGHIDHVNSVAYSPDGKSIVSGSGDRGIGDNTVRIWDSESEEQLRSIKGHTGFVSSVSFSSDGYRIASGGRHDNTIRIWDGYTGVELQCLSGHTDWVTEVAFSPDAKLIASGGGSLQGNDKTVRIWDAISGALIQTLRGLKYPVTSVAISPNGTRVVTGSGSGSLHNAVHIWDVASGDSLQSIDGARCAAFSSDGTRIVSGDEFGFVHMWDAETGQKLKGFRGHANIVNSVVFSPDGTQIASGSDDETVRLWNVQTGEELLCTSIQANFVKSIAFSSDGRRVVSSCGALKGESTVHVWDAISGNHLEIIQGRIDAGVIALGPDVHPFRMSPRGGDWVVEDATTGQTVAWFPLEMNENANQMGDIATHPTESMWAAGISKYLNLVRLEGHPERPCGYLMGFRQKSENSPTRP